MKRRIHVFYSGQVQGGGFRFTTRQLARNMGITGWVRNLRDGRVELVAQAGEQTLKDFLSRIEQYCRRYIQDTDISWEEPQGEFRDFGMRF